MYEKGVFMKLSNKKLAKHVDFRRFFVETGDIVKWSSNKKLGFRWSEPGVVVDYAAGYRRWVQYGVSILGCKGKIKNK